MRSNLFKKVSAAVMTLSMVVGLAGVVPAAVRKGADISSAVSWKSFSVHTREDGGEWEDALIKDGQSYNNTENVFKSYTDNAKFTTSTPTSFLMNVISTGSSANWAPTKKTDDLGNQVWEAATSNPWGVTATKIVKIEKGRTYTISFKIKSTLKNEIKKTEKVPGKYYYQTEDKNKKVTVHYTDSVVKKGNTYVDKATGNQVSHVGIAKGTGAYNYMKHIHFKAYRNNEKDGDPALKLKNVKATYNGQSVYSKKGDYTFIALDGRNTDYVNVTATVTVPGDNLAYKQNTMGIKFAFGSFTMEYPNENDMSGTIDVRDFKVVAGNAVATSKLKSAKGAKKAIKVATKKVKGAKSYEFQYARNKAFTGKKTVKSKKPKTTLKGKKIKSKKTYYVRVRVKTKKGYTVWSKAKKVKVK